MKRILTNIIYDAREALTPVATVSNFSSTGQLTPKEFVQAGDHLTYKWPFWIWKSAKNYASKAYLPAEKQFLETNGIVSKKRYKEGHRVQEHVVEKGEWIDTLNYADISSPISSPEDIPDISDILDADDDVDTLSSTDSENFGLVEGEDDATIVSKRYDEYKNWRVYNLNITYDSYYRTPRLWIIGYDAYNNMLSHEEIFEDISPEHTKQTVTLERHPFTGLMCLSVHPCQHANMLKNLTDIMNNKDIERVLEVFLRMVVTILPTADFLARGMD